VLISPEELVNALKSAPAAKPLVLFVGFQVLYPQAHPPGAEFVGPASREEFLEKLRKLTQPLPRKKLIVIYCGCCPWDHCPNVKPAYDALHAMGFTNLKALHIANDFGRDWVDKGYPVEKGQP